MTTNYFIQIAICIAFILCLWLISLYLSKKKSFFYKNKSTDRIKFIEKRAINKNAYLMIVEVDGSELLVSVNHQQTSVLKVLNKE